MTARVRVVGPTASTAAKVFGNLIAQGRRERAMTLDQLAEAIGTSPRTVYSIEHGKPSVSLGTYFEAASVLGIPLFSADKSELTRLLRDGRDRLALLPERVRAKEIQFDANF
jgi:transcriptional regulator with XRE-family HTH domain